MHLVFYTSHSNSIDTTVHCNELSHYISSPNQFYQDRSHSTATAIQCSWMLIGCLLHALHLPLKPYRNQPSPLHCTCLLAFDLIGWTLPEGRVKLGCPLLKRQRQTVKRNCWVLLGYLLLNLWFMADVMLSGNEFENALLAGRGLWDWGPRNSWAAQWGTGTQ